MSAKTGGGTNACGKAREAKRRKTAVCLFLAVILLTYGFTFGKAGISRLEKSGSSMLFLLDTKPLTVEQTKEIRRMEAEQEEPHDFAAWHQEQGVSLENRQLGRSVLVSALYICGRSELVLREGARLEEEDANGCLIDEQTAQELYGSTRAEDMELRCGERTLTVRGILHSVEKTMVCTAAEGAEIYMTALSVACSPAQEEQVREEFTMRYGLPDRVVSARIPLRLCRFLYVLFVLLTGGCVILYCAARAWKKSGGPANRILCVASALILSALLCMFFAKHVRIPKDMIPTKWSDFSFWRNWLEREKTSFLLLLLTEKQKPQQLWTAQTAACLKCAAAGMAGWWFLRAGLHQS